MLANSSSRTRRKGGEKKQVLRLQATAQHFCNETIIVLNDVAVEIALIN